MKVLLSWLRDFAPIEGDPVALGEQMSDLGMAVEQLDVLGEGLDGIVVAEVLATRSHPNADKIQLVDVDAGDGEALQIACGAFNMAPGDLVPLATLGTTMPNGMEIGRRKMRGEWSNGMLCSARELGLGGDHAGIHILPAGLPVGAPFVEAMGIESDALYDLEINPNRPDAMSVAGVARDLAIETSGCRLMFMQSHGGLTEAGNFRGKDAILSGPAGGIVGMVRMSRRAGLDKVIGFDMGGTSTDVAHFAGQFERTFHTEVAGVRLRAPMLDINTVAAGGGSVLHFDGARYRVGPDSAGALPGPAAYGFGGPLTVTDANVMLGKLRPGFFPAVFGPDADQPLDAEVVADRFAALAAEVSVATGRAMTPVELAEGFVTSAAVLRHLQADPLLPAALQPAQQHAQVVHHRREHARPEPALGLLIDRLPRRELVRQIAPLGAGAHEPAQGVVHLPQVVRALRRIGPQQRQIGRDEGPLLIGHVGWIGGAGRGRFHAPSLPSP